MHASNSALSLGEEKEINCLIEFKVTERHKISGTSHLFCNLNENWFANQMISFAPVKFMRVLTHGILSGYH